MKLRHWYTIWALSEAAPNVGELPDALRPRDAGLLVEFAEDCGHECWRRVYLRESGSPHPAVMLSRWSLGDEDFDSQRIRAVEWISNLPGEPHADEVLVHVRNARQLISVKPLADGFGAAKLARICEQASGFLARETRGMIQVYQEGFFNLEGNSLLPLCAKHKLKTG